MTKRYLHIGFGMLDVQRLSKLDAEFNRLSEDWFRYTGNAWLTWTPYEASVWFNALKPHLKAGEHLLILELKINQGVVHGVLPQWAWNWLNKVRY